MDGQRTVMSSRLTAEIAALHLPPEPWQFDRVQWVALWRLRHTVALRELPNGEPVLDEPFLIWPAGTLQMEMWEWFDDWYTDGVRQLEEDARLWA